MNGAIDLILNGKLQSDLDCGSKKLLNLDASNLGLGDFGIVNPHTVFAGAASESEAVPTFRLLTASEVGAEPHTAGLTSLSTVTPTATGKNFVGLTNPVSAGYPKIATDQSITVLTPALLRADINAQLHSNGLDALSGLTPTLTGKNLLVLTNPTQTGFVKIGNDLDNTVSVRTPAQVISDLGIVGAPFIDSTAIIKGSADATKTFGIEVDGFTTGTKRTMTPPNYDFTPASVLGSEALKNKIVNGLTLAVGTAASGAGSVTYTDVPGNPFQLSLVAVAGTGVTAVLRATAPTDIVLPTTGTLSTVAGTIPFSYLSTSSDLRPGLHTKVASQLAVKNYVDAHTGTILPAPTDTVASATSVDLTGITDYQITVTGTTPIQGFVLNDGDEHLLLFDDALLLTQGTFLNVVGGLTKSVAAGDYAIVRGGAGGMVTVSDFIRADRSKTMQSDAVSIVDPGSGHFLTLVTEGLGGGNSTMLIVNPSSRTLSMGGDIQVEGGLFTSGAHDLIFTLPAAANVTIPSTGTLEARVGVPASAGASGVAGQVAYDASFVYRCISANVWKRSAISTW